MDITILASLLTSALVSFLTKSSDKIAEKAGEQIGEEVGEGLWEKVKQLFSSDELIQLKLEEDIKSADKDEEQFNKIVGLLENLLRKNTVDENGKTVNNEIKVDTAKYILSSYPTYPLVKPEDVSDRIIEMVSESVPIDDAAAIISQANRFRKDANPGDEGVTVIRQNRLPAIHHTNSLVYWRRAFDEAKLNGPRMLAALLLTIPDNNFTSDARREKYQLLDLLKNYRH